jgi:hypothetical protein
MDFMKDYLQAYEVQRKAVLTAFETADKFWNNAVQYFFKHAESVLKK